MVDQGRAATPRRVIVRRQRSEAGRRSRARTTNRSSSWPASRHEASTRRQRRSCAGALLEFADRGGAVLWIAAEFDELLEVADRLVVAFHGRLSESFVPPFDRRLVGLTMGGGE